MWKELHVNQTRFRNRAEAGQMLAARLRQFARNPDLLVLGLPRGGVAVAAEIALALGAPLDVFIVRKLGVPGYEELAMGAVACGGTRVMNNEVIESLGISEEAIELVVTTELRELARREQLYRRDLPPLDVAGKTVIVVDDGLATGATMRAALVALRTQMPARLIVAAPVGAAESVATMREFADEVLCLLVPEPFHAIGLWYQRFEQLEDEEVRALLNMAERERLDGVRQ